MADPHKKSKRSPAVGDSRAHTGSSARPGSSDGGGSSGSRPARTRAGTVLMPATPPPEPTSTSGAASRPGGTLLLEPDIDDATTDVASSDAPTPRNTSGTRAPELAPRQPRVQTNTIRLPSATQQSIQLGAPGPRVRSSTLRSNVDQVLEELNRAPGLESIDDTTSAVGAARTGEPPPSVSVEEASPVSFADTTPTHEVWPAQEAHAWSRPAWQPSGQAVVRAGDEAGPHSDTRPPPSSAPPSSDDEAVHTTDMQLPEEVRRRLFRDDD